MVLSTLLAWALAGSSIGVVTYMRLETWRMVMPLVLMALGMMLWAVNSASSLVLMLRQHPKSEDFYVYLFNLVLNSAPLLYFAFKMARYPGPRTQFLFEWFTNGTRHLLE